MATQNNLGIPADLLAQVQRLADSQGRTAGDLAADALQRYLEAHRNLLDWEDLVSWGERHAQERGFKPSDVETAISEIRLRRRP
jgi:hypothetical protein